MYQRKRLSPWTRAFIVSEAERIGVSRAARQSGISRRTVYRWRRRAPDVADRSCRPHHSPRRSAETLEGTLVALRMDTQDGPDRIGPTLGLHPSTVHRILRRHRVNRLSHLFPKPPRSFGSYPALRPGELVGVDIKSFGSIERGGGRRAEHHRTERPVGWKHLHVAIDMASRMTFTEFRPTVGGSDGAAFVDQAVAFFAQHGVRVERVLSDNGSAYTRASRSGMPAAPRGSATPGPSHGTPGRTAGAERFISTIQRGAHSGTSAAATRTWPS